MFVVYTNSEAWTNRIDDGSILYLDGEQIIAGNKSYRREVKLETWNLQFWALWCIFRLIYRHILTNDFSVILISIFQQM